MKTKTKNKNEKKQKNRKRKRIFHKIILCLLAVVIVIYSVGGYLLFSYALERENFINRISVALTNHAAYNDKRGEETTNWLTKNSDDMYIYSFDDLKLHALFAESEKYSSRYVIVCHGYASRASHMSKYANKFYNLGYNVLVPDARAHGDSEGKFRGMGYLERKDILLWINEILKMDGNAQIVLYGVSMGAATVMFTAAEAALPKNVVCVIEDCGYTSVFDEISHMVTKYTKLPYSILVRSASVVSRFCAGYSFRQASCVKALKNCKIPILFIHGGKDKTVPFEMLDKLYDAADCKKEKLVIESAGHGKSSSVEPDMYWKSVNTFINVYSPHGRTSPT